MLGRDGAPGGLGRAGPGPPVFQAGQGVSLWYVPTGLTMALLLLGGLFYAPVLLLTDPLSKLLASGPELGWGSTAARASLTTVVYTDRAGLLRHRLRIDPRLRAQRDVTWFVAVACLLAPTLVAVVQVA